MSVDLMTLVVGVVVGLSAAIPASLAVFDILNRLDARSTPADEIVDIYQRGIVDGARIAERLGAGGSVTTLADRHAMEVRRG